MIIIAEGSQRRVLEDHQFPLMVGGTDSDIVVEETSPTVALLGLSEGDLFIQPEAGSRVRYNGQWLQKSQWLKEMDTLEIDGLSLVLETEAEGLCLQITRSEHQTALLSQPSEPNTPSQAGPSIKPIVFQPTPLNETSKRGGVGLKTLVFLFVLMALGSLAFFIFFARAVTIQITPQPDDLIIEGAVFSPVFKGRHLLWPGEYGIIAKKEGYQDLVTAFKVNTDALQQFPFHMERLPGFLRVQTLPGATITIDGEVRGEAPLDAIELRPGKYQIQVHADRYFPFSANFTMEGTGNILDLKAPLQPKWAPVQFQTEPPGALVRVEGKTLGRTPLTTDLSEGSYSLDLLLKGYKPKRGKLRVKAGQPLTTPRVTLQPSDGSLVLDSNPSGAAVTVNGTYRGETPLDLRLNPGRKHQILMVKAGHEPKRGVFQPRSGESSEVLMTLTPQQGELRINCFPANAQLKVNGEKKGKANGTHQLQSLPQHLEISKEGFQTYETRLTPLPGFPKALEVNLKTLVQAKKDAIQQRYTTSQGHHFQLIEPGPFKMGASRREPGRRANELLRDLTMTKAFYLGVEEVSNGQFKRFSKQHDSGTIGNQTLDMDDQPVVRIRWEDAVAYCNWLSSEEGLPQFYVRREEKWVPAIPLNHGYRLPTEAEWAFAARQANGPTNLKYPWGQKLPVPPDSGNFADVSAGAMLTGTLAGYNDGYAATAPVTQYPANGLGIRNLGGNVAEWTHDVYGLTQSQANTMQNDPLGPEKGVSHVIRGSSWMHSTVTELRLSFRDFGEDPRPDLGFRIARYLE